jgi:hypothetical protein
MKTNTSKLNVLLTLATGLLLIQPQIQAISLSSLSAQLSENRTVACLMGGLVMATAALGLYAYKKSRALYEKEQELQNKNSAIDYRNTRITSLQAAKKQLEHASDQLRTLNTQMTTQRNEELEHFSKIFENYSNQNNLLFAFSQKKAKQAQHLTQANRRLGQELGTARNNLAHSQAEIARLTTSNQLLQAQAMPPVSALSVAAGSAGNIDRKHTSEARAAKQPTNTCTPQVIEIAKELNKPEEQARQQAARQVEQADKSVAASRAARKQSKIERAARIEAIGKGSAAARSQYVFSAPYSLTDPIAKVIARTVYGHGKGSERKKDRKRTAFEREQAKIAVHA